MTAAEWAREGYHSETGRYTVEASSNIYAAHALSPTPISNPCGAARRKYNV
jgi:hypothetical protein